MSNHVVNKLNFLLPSNGYNQARQHQHDARHWAIHSLPVLLNKYFTNINTDEDIIFFEKIEIDISCLPWDLSDAEWNLEFEKSIRPLRNAEQAFLIVLKQWFFYLFNGCFQRSAIFKTVREFESYILLHEKQLAGSNLVLDINSPITLPFLQRLFFQHSKRTVIAVTEKLFNITYEQGNQLYKTILRQLATHPVKIHRVMVMLFHMNGPGQLINRDKLIAFLLKPGENMEAEDLIAVMNNKVDPHTDAGKDITLESGIDCTNAGLVLLFPYLQRFFDNLHITGNDKFINEAAKKLAIQSLYFLATGNDIGPEEEYVLPKLMCGVMPDQYIDFVSELPENCKLEANDLLTSVIKYWDKLQNTSIDGFRNTFLQRKGKLVKQDIQYILHVEESGADILLHSIPWGFRNYKLPWMHITLITEWY